jgi:hypothetical protein
MKDNFWEALAQLEALEKPATPQSPAAKTAKTKVDLHNTDDDLREPSRYGDLASPPVGPVHNDEKLQTSKRPTVKTAKSPNEFLEPPEAPTAKTAKTPEDDVGMIASWAKEFGYIAIRDPGSGQWHDIQVKDAPGWALGEARRRKELYRDGNRNAYRLTSREIEELREAEHPVIEEGIVEDHPLEDV